MAQPSHWGPVRGQVVHPCQTPVRFPELCPGQLQLDPALCKQLWLPLHSKINVLRSETHFLQTYLEPYLHKHPPSLLFLGEENSIALHPSCLNYSSPLSHLFCISSVPLTHFLPWFLPASEEHSSRGFHSHSTPSHGLNHHPDPDGAQIYILSSDLPHKLWPSQWLLDISTQMPNREL